MIESVSIWLGPQLNISSQAIRQLLLSVLCVAMAMEKRQQGKWSSGF